MKIGIFTECYKPTMNGVVVSIETFKEELEKRGHKIYIFAPHTKKFNDTESRIYRVPSIAWPGQGYYPLALPFLSPWVYDVAEKEKLDIVHCQHLFGMGDLGLSVGRKLEIPVVYTYHTLIAEYTHYVPVVHSLIKKYIIGRSQKFCNSCDQIITPTFSMKRTLLKYGVKSPIDIIPTGIELKNYQKIDSRPFRAKYNISDNLPILLYVGRLAEEKNISFLLKAFKIVISKTPAHLVLVGGGPQENIYRKKVNDLKINGSVTFTGYLPKKETEKAFGMADIFVFASTTDTQGIVIIEAMASGTPPVAVAKMGPTNIITSGKDGYLTDLTLTDFSGKISYILKNPDIRKKLAAESINTSKKYSSQITADKMENIYQKLITRSIYTNEKNSLYSRPDTL